MISKPSILLNASSRYLGVLCALVIGVLGLSGCTESKAKSQEQVQEEYEVPVETQAIRIGSISNTYRSTAILQAQTQVTVSNKVVGVIKQLHVEEGDRVIAGQLLAELDDESYQLELEKVNIDLASAESDLQRSQPVDGRLLVSDKELEKLKFLVQIKQNEQTLAAIKVRDTRVLAPITGVIAERLVEPQNMLAKVAEDMFQLVSLRELEAVLYLPESELMKVKLGQDASLTFPAIEGVAVTANVTGIAPIVDSESGTFKVTLQIDNPNFTLKPGMFASVALTLDRHEQAYLVPQNALITEAGKSRLFVVVDGKAKQVEVQTGYQQDGWVEITTELSGDMEVVIAGQQSLKAETKVQVIARYLASGERLASNSAASKLTTL